jgi:hypothetical protein
MLKARGWSKAATDIYDPKSIEERREVAGEKKGVTPIFT